MVAGGGYATAVYATAWPGPAQACAGVECLLAISLCNIVLLVVRRIVLLIATLFPGVHLALSIRHLRPRAYKHLIATLPWASALAPLA